MHRTLEDHTRGLLSELTLAVDELVKENRALRAQILQYEQKYGTGYHQPSAAERLRGLFKTYRRKHVVKSNVLGVLPDLHKDLVWEVNFGDGVLVSASVDHTARIWSVSGGDGKCAVVYRGHKGSVNSARFHPSNPKLMCTASGDLEIHLFKVPELDKSKDLQRNGDENRVKEDQDVVVVDDDDDDDIAVRSHSLPVLVLGPNDYPPRPEDDIFDADGDTGTGSISPVDDGSNKSNYFEDVQDNANILVKRSSSLPNVFDEKSIPASNMINIEAPDAFVKAHSEPVVCADWITTGEMIASGSWDSICTIWSVGNGEITQVQQLKGHEDRISNLDTLADMKVVLTSSKDHSFRLWDLRTTSAPVSVFQGHSGPVTSAVFGKVGGADIVASAGEDRTIQIWDIRFVNSCISDIQCSSVANRLSFSPKTNLLAAPHDNGKISIYSGEGEILQILEQPDALEYRFPALSSCWSLDEQMIYSTGWDRKISFWKSVSV
jgi:WD40 repeat protein